MNGIRPGITGITAAVLLFLLSCAVPRSYALDVKRTVLENGLVLLTVERHNLPMVRVSLGINAGSLHEGADKAGLASLAAGLLTEGTKNRTAQQISEEIEFVGGELGASGGDDYVTAGLSVLKKDTALGLNLLSDIILNPLFPEPEIGKMKERIKGALRAKEESPGYVASRIFRSEIFGSHPYGRVVMGTPETLDSITREDLVSFHRDHYVPAQTIMAVVGDITHAEAEALIREYFGTWHQADAAAPDIPVATTTKRRKTVTVDKDLTQATIILGHGGISRGAPDYYAVSVMNYILGGGGFASRLMQNIREEKGLVYDISSVFSADRYGGSFEVSLQTSNETANRAIGEILREVQLMQHAPVSDQELSDAKSFLTGSFPMRIETSARIAGFLVAVEYYGLGLEYIDEYADYINSVSKEDVLRVARTYLDADKYVLVVVADQDKAALQEEYR